MATRTYGELWLKGDCWHLRAEPHVTMWAKRIFKRVPGGHAGVMKLSNTPATCRDLEWFLQRFPLDVKDRDTLTAQAKAHVDHIARLDQIIDTKYQPRPFGLAVPAREYQQRAAEMFVHARSLLLGDDVGLGKTASAIAALTEPSTRPAVVVCLAHLPRQWEREINRFAPQLHTHVIRKSTPYELPRFMGRGMDVLIISYHKLAGWADVLGKYCKTIVFDEAQELRRSGTKQSPSQKYTAAKSIAEECDYRWGLSATPIYNYGGEMFNVLEVLAPGSLGTHSEFHQEWCVGSDDKARLKDPAAFGAWLREQHLMLRRTRKDVGRELAELSRITHTVDCDSAALKQIEGKAGELAALILSEVAQPRGVQMQAAEEFSNVLRQATGIAKAPYVAEFVRLLLENGEPVVLFGWHRAVYEIWLEKLKEFRPALYTGSESVAAKQEAVCKFTAKDTDLLIVSLRSGAGVDGLQKRCRTVVFGELDWSPGVLEQCIGRIHRDGQTDPVAAYFLLSDSGADPLMAETLGLKRDQIEGIRGRDGDDVLQRNDGDSAIRRLAEQYLSRPRTRAAS